jgi:hypothetical protein
MHQKVYNTTNTVYNTKKKSSSTVPIVVWVVEVHATTSRRAVELVRL